MIYSLLLSGGNDSFQRLAGRSLGLSQSSIKKACGVCIDIFFDHFVPKFIVLPTREEALREAMLFNERSGFPAIAWAAIDGTHINVSYYKPEKKRHV